MIKKFEISSMGFQGHSFLTLYRLQFQKYFKNICQVWNYFPQAQLNQKKMHTTRIKKKFSKKIANYKFTKHLWPSWNNSVSMVKHTFGDRTHIDVYIKQFEGQVMWNFTNFHSPQLCFVHSQCIHLYWYNMELKKLFVCQHEPI